MLTFENMYKQQKGTEQYELTWQKNGYRVLWLISNPQMWDNVTKIDWDSISLEGVDIAKGAYDYALMAGLMPDEINNLMKKITD